MLTYEREQKSEGLITIHVGSKLPTWVLNVKVKSEENVVWLSIEMAINK